MNPKTLGKIVSRTIPGSLLLMGGLAEWYGKNSYHRFDSGDLLILRKRNIFGFGIRPVVVVESYLEFDPSSKEGGEYEVILHKDGFNSGSGWEIRSRWMRSNEIPRDVKRISELGTYSKWNMEYLFRRVRADSVEEALDLYGSTLIE